MNRRDLIRNMLLSGAAIGAWSSGVPFRFTTTSAQAQTTQTKTLVKVFQRGGCDGLNVVVPYAEDEYYNLRPTIGIAPPNTSGGAGALDLDGFFGLHPSMTAMHQLYQQGALAILPATHYPNGSRSHFRSQYYVESGQREDESTGWMNRHLSSFDQAGLMRAVSIGNDLEQALRGDIPVTTINSFNQIGLEIEQEEEAALLARLREIYAHPPAELANHRLVHSFGQQMLNDIDTLVRIRDLPYSPENGAQYTGSGFGGDLQMVARIIKADVGLELANVNIGGWDTHSQQGGAEGRQAGRLADMSQNIAAFYADMGARQSDVSVMVGTEFGRTSRENGSNGTDHGFAAAWFLLGGSVNGGQIYGTWPGLNEDQLERGRYLQMSVDYRDIYGDVLSGLFGSNNVNAVLPPSDGYNYNSLGLYS